MPELPEFNDPDTLYLIDLSGFIHRYFHVGPQWAGRNFAEMLKKLLQRRAPARVAVCEDLQLPTFRHQMTETYKANRNDRSVQEKVAILEQMRIATELVDDVYGLRRFAVAGFEADDLLATLASWGVEDGLRVVVMAFDKDMFQLIGPNVMMWDGKDKVTGAEQVHEKLGVWPNQIVDYLSMVGDSSDNIPGVWGCGPVAAVSVLGAFGTLKAALESAERGREDHPFWKANAKVWARIAGARPAIELARKLVTLRRDVPLRLDSLEELAVPEDASP